MNQRWYSHKFNGPALRYEVAVSIHGGDVVWAYGGVPAGETNDLMLARMAYIHRVDHGEKTIADSVYRDHIFFVNSPSLGQYNPEDHNQTILRRICLGMKM